MSKSKKDFQPHWRPNFVNSATLPDIKVIRTDFIINFVSVVLSLMVGILVLQREYRAYILGQTVASMEQQISQAEASDNANLNLSREFRDAAAHVAEVEKFYAAPFKVQDLLAQLAEMRPDELIFKNVSLAESMEKVGENQVVVYRINITGEVRSLTVLDTFKGELGEWDLLKYEGYALSIDEQLQARDTQTNIFPYTLEISLKPSKNEPASPAEAVDA